MINHFAIANKNCLRGMNTLKITQKMKNEKKMKNGINHCDFLQKGMCECHNEVKNSQKLTFYKSVVVHTHTNKFSQPAKN